MLDALIIGAGFSGLAAARSLARPGLQVAVIEALARWQRPDPRRARRRRGGGRGGLRQPSPSTGPATTTLLSVSVILGIVKTVLLGKKGCTSHPRIDQRHET